MGLESRQAAGDLYPLRPPGPEVVLLFRIDTVANRPLLRTGSGYESVAASNRQRLRIGSGFESVAVVNCELAVIANRKW